MIRLNDILDRVQKYRPEADLDLIKKAYVYSAKVHQGQIRKSGEPYLVHPLEVAGILADLKLDEASIVAGMLHDTIEDTLAKPEEIKELFGPEVLALDEGVTKLSAIPVPDATHEETCNDSTLDRPGAVLAPRHFLRRLRRRQLHPEHSIHSRANAQGDAYP